MGRMGAPMGVDIDPVKCMTDAYSTIEFPLVEYGPYYMVKNNIDPFSTIDGKTDHQPKVHSPVTVP